MLASPAPGGDSSGESVVAVPVWPDGGRQIAMEPIPEDEEENALSPSTSSLVMVQSKTSNGLPASVQSNPESPTGTTARRITESKQRLKEVYTTEEVDTLVSTLPKDSVPLEWDNFSSEEVVVDPKMAHTYVTELVGGMPSARATKYSYTYESRLEEGGDGAGEETESELRREEQQRQLTREVQLGEDGVERHCTSTQKVTRVTKITTTRHVKQIPVEPGDLFFDADGNPILNGFDAQNLSRPSTNTDEDDFAASPAGAGLDGSVGIDLSRTYISESEQYYSSPPTTSTARQGESSSQQSVSPPSDRYFTCTPDPNWHNSASASASPSAPGVPQVTDLTDSTVSLAWFRPDFDGTSGPLIGYRVEFRRSEFDDWDPAHDDLLGETECKISTSTMLTRARQESVEYLREEFTGSTLLVERRLWETITNLDPEECYQFRVLGANISGFGAPSSACAPIQLRKAGATAVEEEGPPPPGRPQVLSVEGDRAAIEWRPSLADPSVTSVNGTGKREFGRAPAVVGYLVECRPEGASSWLSANDRPTREHRFLVQNLRPNGEYEFRVLACDQLGRQSASPSSGFVRIRPAVPVRQQSGTIPTNAAAPDPPGRPRLLESGPDWVHLHWDPPSPMPSQPIAYLVEMRQPAAECWTALGEQRIEGADEEDGGGLVSSSLDHFIVENLSPEVDYEFRVWTVSLVNALRSATASAVSETVRLRTADWSLSSGQPQQSVPSRRPPERPAAPEYLEYDGGTSLTLCWLPAKSALPVQGYELEFRDMMQDTEHWYKMADQLVRACKTTVGYLLNGHQYQFRICAKNAVGVSPPSDPSPLLTIGAAEAPKHPPNGKYMESERHISVPLMDEIVRESPPLPDRDDSPPPIYRQTESSLQWRDPTLKEVIDYLKSPDPTLVLDASGYLQHLTFNNDVIKEETRNYGGIECLIVLLRTDNTEILRNACGCLKNLAFGRANDTNKRLINQKGGVKALAHLLKTYSSPLVHEEATGALWNISSSDELKEAVLNQAAEMVVAYAVLPSVAHVSRQPGQSQVHSVQNGAHPTAPASQRNPPTANVFRNGTGILRNISAANDTARRFLRSAHGLIDALLYFLEGALQRGQLDTRSVENVVCLLRNLSYRVQEVVDSKYDPNRTRYQIHGAEQQSNGSMSARSERSRSAPSGSPKTPSSSVGKRAGVRLFRKAGKGRAAADSELNDAVPLATGSHRLWHPSTVKLYLRVLQDSADCEILEASAAALQNLAGCPFEGSALVRQTVRTEKGLPILVELLRLREDRVVCAVCCALRNLALDQRNLELIGKYALRELLTKVPDRNALDILQEHPSIVGSPDGLAYVSDATIGAILGILWEAVRHSAELARAVHDTAEGTERLRTLAKSYPTYGRRVCKYATQVLYMMWQHKELHELFRRSGLSETDFYSGTLHKGTKHPEKHSPSSAAATLARPFSSQGMERPSHLPLPPSRMDDSADTSHYGAYSTPPQLAKVTPPIGAKQTTPRDNGHHRHHYDPNVLPEQQLYASVQKESGRGGRRLSIDSWV